MRRGIGVKGLQKKKEHSQKLKNVGQKVHAEKMSVIQRQLQTFKEKLETFACEHKKEINKNPYFRSQFHNMCVNVGVDPLASHKGFWAELLGVGDFYYELSVQIIHICLSTKKINGGLICLQELLTKLKKMRGKNSADISESDIVYSIQKIHVLGDGYRFINVGNNKMVVSVPLELNTDHTNILKLANDKYYFTLEMIKNEYNWPPERINSVINMMMNEEMIWIDRQIDSQNREKIQFWVPSLFTNANHQ